MKLKRILMCKKCVTNTKTFTKLSAFRSGKNRLYSFKTKTKGKFNFEISLESSCGTEVSFCKNK